MATLGGRDMSKRNNPKTPQTPAVGIGTQPVNLVASPVRIQPVATLGLQPSCFGSPIMREGFITSTGFLPPMTNGS
jgi:hypothetical protein